MRRKRKLTFERVAKKLGDSRLFSQALVFALQPDGELLLLLLLLSFVTSAALQQHLVNDDLIGLLQPIFARKTLSEEERTLIISRYGCNTAKCKAAFEALNNNTLRMLLRCMDFKDLQQIFSKGDDENMPEHMRTHSESYVFVGKYLDPDMGRVSEHKFEGKNKQIGRFQAQDIPDEVLCQSKRRAMSTSRRPRVQYFRHGDVRKN
jgi:hypothetical protein